MSGSQFKALYQYAYERSRDQNTAEPAHHEIVIVGAGPVGLALAIDLAQRGVKVVLLDDNDRISEGSRAICFSKRCLEVCDTLGVAEKMVAKGVTWQVGKVFLEDEQVYQFDLLPEDGHKQPAFINLQQYYVEAFLVERASELDLIDLRWRNKVTAISPDKDGTTVTIDTPDGSYDIRADWLVACDGARSPLRTMMGLDFKGQVFRDQFLIADVKMKAGFPTERWFWFDPPFHKGQSTLLHKQPDDVWRIDFQIGWDADPVEERKWENVEPRLRAMLGEDAEVREEWTSIYTFQCMRMEKFVHHRVIFAGDAAHQVSPFGARGANSGIEDAHNLSWKLALVLAGKSGPYLISSYGHERELAAEDNIGHSTRATDFITPKNDAARRFRNAALKLSRSAPFARTMVNSGRLSTPSLYEGSSLNTPDTDVWSGGPQPGQVAFDARLSLPDGKTCWLLNELGPGFTVFHMGAGETVTAPAGVTLKVIGADMDDEEGFFADRFDAQPGTTYLLRPDHYVAARFKSCDQNAIEHALKRAQGHS